jgi:hypothetical protein
MSDYYFAIFQAVSKLDKATVASRQQVYGRAREELVEGLRRHIPAIPDSEIARECHALEVAAHEVEAKVYRSQNEGAADAERVDQKLISPEPASAGHMKQINRGKEPDAIRDPILRAIELSKASDRSPLVTENTRHGVLESAAQHPSPHSSSGIGVSLLALLYFFLGLIQIPPFFEGLDAWRELSLIARTGIFAAFVLLGSFGSIPTFVITFYGAWHGWHWPVWSAALLPLPFVTLSFAWLGRGGIYTLTKKLLPG